MVASDQPPPELDPDPRRIASSSRIRVSRARLRVWATVPSGSWAPRPGAPSSPPLGVPQDVAAGGHGGVLDEVQGADRVEGVEAVRRDREVRAHLDIGPRVRLEDRGVDPGLLKGHGGDRPATPPPAMSTCIVVSFP